MSDFPLDEDLISPPVSPSPSDRTQLNDRMRMLTNDFRISSLEEEMTPTQLHFTWPSDDDIPVLLYDAEYVNLEGDWDQEPQEDSVVKEFSLSDLTIASVVNTNFAGNRRSSCVSLSSITSSGVNDLRRPTSRLSWTGASRPASGFLGLQSLDSSNTISSVGTFGPGRKNHRNPSGEQAVSGPQVGEEDCVFTGGPGVLRDRSSIPQNPAGIFASPSVLADLKRVSLVDSMSLSETAGTHRQRRGSCGRDSRTSEVDFSADNSAGNLEESESVLESPSTPRKPIPKTISWISSRDWNCQQYKEYVAQADLSFSPQTPTRGRRCDDENEDANSTPPTLRLRRSPVRSKDLEHRDLNVILETPRSSQIAKAIHDQEHQVEKSVSHEPKTRYPSPPRNPILQDEYSWLKDITVQFLIDQEGFRAAYPSFKFSGISRLRYPPNGSNASSVTMAQFRPITRQAFHFHYAPFESPPILRRVTVNMDETHDYLTKQALLTLKSNGVYVLHGQEISHSPSAASVELSSAESSKLYWQFEYMIDDRRVEASRRIMEGEKNFIPLTFSCSPGLLSPAQGKRNSIMHVFKKGLAIKLVSEKLQPPGILAAPTTNTKPLNGNEASHPPPPHPTAVGDSAHISNFFTVAKAHAWNIHRRGQSHGVQSTGPPKFTFHHKIHLHDGEGKNLPVQHKRASSAWDSNQLASSGLHFSSDTHASTAATHSSPPADSRITVPVMIPPSRHIIPPKKLAEILDNGSPPKVGQPITSISPSNKFAPLSPRPRKTSHAKAPSYPHTP